MGLFVHVPNDWVSRKYPLAPFSIQGRTYREYCPHTFLILALLAVGASLAMLINRWLWMSISIGQAVRRESPCTEERTNGELEFSFNIQ